jgi:ABC-2 type transport system permease protein
MILFDALIIAEKELIQLWRDKPSLCLTFLVPVFIFITFGLTVPSTEQSYTVPVVLCNLDNSTLAENYLNFIKNSSYFQVVQIVDIEDKIRTMVEEGKAPSAIIIPKGFEEEIFYNESVLIRIVVDDSKHRIADTVKAGIASVTASFMQEQLQRKSLVIVSEQTITGKQVSVRAPVSVIVFGIAIVYGCFDDVAGAMARERERGTLTRLYLSPVSRWAIFIGKTLSSLFLTQIRTTILLLLLLLYLQVSIVGNLLYVYLVASLIASTTIALGFVISSRPISSRSVVILEVALLLPLMFLTELIRPIELMPQNVQFVIRLIPYNYANDALRRVILLGQGLERVWSDIVIMLGATCFLFAVACFLFKRKIQ